jgi:hypothetical protein
MHRTYRCHQNAYFAYADTCRAMAAAYRAMQKDDSGSVFTNRCIPHRYLSSMLGKPCYPKGYTGMCAAYRGIINTPPRGGYPHPPPPPSTPPPLGGALGGATTTKSPSLLQSRVR